MTSEFHREAKAEFLAAIAHYEQCEEGLGLDFAREVQLSIDRVLQLPNAWPALEGDVRPSDAAHDGQI